MLPYHTAQLHKAGALLFFTAEMAVRLFIAQPVATH